MRTESSPKKSDEKWSRGVWGWALYDWANSAFATTVMAGFFPLFFKSYWSSDSASVESSARLGTTISIASLIIAIISPLLGVLADRHSLKKKFLFHFMILGVISCALLFFVPSGAWLFASLLYGLGTIGFASSCVYYDALLPAVVGTEHDSHRVSALGFSLGYLGGGVLFLLNVLFFLKPEWFGFGVGTAGQVRAIKVSFVSVSAWWLLFSIPLFLWVHEESSAQKFRWKDLFQETHRALYSTFQEVLNRRVLLYFLLAYWMYIDGVFTVITMAVDFGANLGLESSHLIRALVITQFVGFPATLFVGKISTRVGPLRLLKLALVSYMVLIVLASRMETETHFYLLAAFVGLFQGGVQSLSRSIFSLLIPKKSETKYFAFYDIIGKFASILGPSLVGWTAYYTQNPRLGILGLLVLLVGGFVFLSRAFADAKPLRENENKNHKPT